MRMNLIGIGENLRAWLLNGPSTELHVKWETALAVIDTTVDRSVIMCAYAIRRTTDESHVLRRIAELAQRARAFVVSVPHRPSA
jgi:hypothetical protein